MPDNRERWRPGRAVGTPKQRSAAADAKRDKLISKLKTTSAAQVEESARTAALKKIIEQL